MSEPHDSIKTMVCKLVTSILVLEFRENLNTSKKTSIIWMCLNIRLSCSKTNKNLTHTGNIPTFFLATFGSITFERDKKPQKTRSRQAGRGVYWFVYSSSFQSYSGTLFYLRVKQNRIHPGKLTSGKHKNHLSLKSGSIIWTIHLHDFKFQNV